MHPSDVLVIGPIHPRGSRVLRVQIRNLFIGLFVVVALALAAALALPLDRQQWLGWLPNGFAINKPDTSAAKTGDTPTFEVDSNPAGQRALRGRATERAATVGRRGWQSPSGDAEGDGQRRRPFRRGPGDRL
jgi:hypothetical protein